MNKPTSTASEKGVDGSVTIPVVEEGGGARTEPFTGLDPDAQEHVVHAMVVRILSDDARGAPLRKTIARLVTSILDEREEQSRVFDGDRARFVVQAVVDELRDRFGDDLLERIGDVMDDAGERFQERIAAAVAPLQTELANATVALGRLAPPTAPTVSPEDPAYAQLRWTQPAVPAAGGKTITLNDTVIPIANQGAKNV